VGAARSDVNAKCENVREIGEKCAMIWTKEDAEDVVRAVEKMREACDKLAEDARSKRARFQTRRALDVAMQALLALDDVYFEDDSGRPVPETWRRARELLRPKR
jgi:pyridoxal biosynthesis lyase PdxS